VGLGGHRSDGPVLKQTGFATVYFRALEAGLRGLRLEMASYFAGVDVGAASAKAAIVDSDGTLTGFAIAPTGVSPPTTAEKVYVDALAKAGVSSDWIETIVSTGYGRNTVERATKSVTEITCHARGAVALYPGTRLVIDIGGQDSKAVALDADGRVKAFEMNDKCAAGTGRFLEVMARALDVRLDEIGRIALSSETPADISSRCTVFAETEVVSLLARGRDVPGILAGLCNSVAERVRGLATRVGIRAEMTMTGGVAKNAGVVRGLETMLGLAANVPDEPQIVGAFGAALIARDM